MLYYLTFLQTFLTKPLRKEGDKGATAVEYGLLVTVIALVMVVGAVLLGDALSALFSDAADEVTPVAPAAP